LSTAVTDVPCVDSRGDEVQGPHVGEDSRLSGLQPQWLLTMGLILAATYPPCKCIRSPLLWDCAPDISLHSKKGRAPFGALPCVYPGSGGRTRTYDQAVNSRPLYQLSYAGIKKRRESALATLRQYRPRSRHRSRRSRDRLLDLEVVSELSAARGVPQFPERFCFNLPYALACHVEFPANLFERATPSIRQAEA
jgi:hypothetical protein